MGRNYHVIIPVVLTAAILVVAARHYAHQPVDFVGEAVLIGTTEGGPDDRRPGTYDQERCDLVFGGDAVINALMPEGK